MQQPKAMGQGAVAGVRNRFQEIFNVLRRRGASAAIAFRSTFEDLTPAPVKYEKTNRRVAAFVFADGTGGGVPIYEGSVWLGWRAGKLAAVTEAEGKLEVRATPDWIRWRRAESPETLAVTNDRLHLDKTRIWIKVVPVEYRRDLTLLETHL